jgi:hypothetical protein
MGVLLDINSHSLMYDGSACFFAVIGELEMFHIITLVFLSIALYNAGLRAVSSAG